MQQRQTETDKDALQTFQFANTDTKSSPKQQTDGWMVTFILRGGEAVLETSSVFQIRFNLGNSRGKQWVLKHAGLFLSIGLLFPHTRPKEINKKK